MPSARMVGARLAGVVVLLGLAGVTVVDNTMFLGRYCEWGVVWDTGIV